MRRVRIGGEGRIRQRDSQPTNSTGWVWENTFAQTLTLEVRLKVTDKHNQLWQHPIPHMYTLAKYSLWVYTRSKGDGVGAVEARGQSSSLSHTAVLTATGVVASRHAITRLRICSLWQRQRQIRGKIRARGGEEWSEVGGEVRDAEEKRKIQTTESP